MGSFNFVTLQKREVLDIVETKGVYYADFSKSAYLKQIPRLKVLYEYFLESFNDINDMYLNGLVFAFLHRDDDGKIRDFPDIETFLETISENRNCILSLWKNFYEHGYIMMALKKELNFNPLLIDINDFQFLMPPCITVPPYNEYSYDTIMTNISEGKYETSPFPTGLIQAHLTCIKNEELLGAWEMLPIESL